MLVLSDMVHIIWNIINNSRICNFFLDVMRADRDGVQTGWTYMSVIIVPWFARFSMLGAMTLKMFSFIEK